MSIDEKKLLENAKKMGEVWVESFNPDGNVDREKILEELGKRTFEGKPVYADLVDSPSEIKAAIEKAILQLEGKLSKKELQSRIKELRPWDCIWDYYQMAFYSIAYSQCPDQEHEFGRQSFLEAFKAGLGFVITLGPALIGVCLPEAHRDENMRIHRATGPAIVWGKEKQYWWHGVQVPDEWIEKTDKVDASQAITWDNIEQRRALCEIIGWDKVIDSIEHTVIDTDDDPQIGVLLEANLPDHGKQKFLRVVEESTGRQFCILAPPDVNTALDAQASINQIPKELFRKGYVRS